MTEETGNNPAQENSKKKEESATGHVKDIFKSKARPPKKMGHGLSDKRPHWKTFKAPGIK